MSKVSVWALSEFQERSTNVGRMAKLTIYTSTLFDPKKKAFLSNISLTVDTSTGLIIGIFQHDDISLADPLPENSIDLRGKFVMPGFVDAHTHIFLHSYE